MLVGLALIFTTLSVRLPTLSGRELMSLTKADEFAVGAMKYGLRRKQAEAGLTDAHLACFETISPSEFTNVVATAISEGMSDEEVTAAIALYRTPAGSRYVEHHGEVAAERRPPPLSEDDIAKIQAFAGLPPGTSRRNRASPGHTMWSRKRWRKSVVTPSRTREQEGQVGRHACRIDKALGGRHSIQSIRDQRWRATARSTNTTPSSSASIAMTNARFTMFAPSNSATDMSVSITAAPTQISSHRKLRVSTPR